MPNRRIIYPNDRGGVAVVHPAPGFTVDDLMHIIPAGSHYKIIDLSEIPTDRSMRDAWTYDFTGCPIKEEDK